MFPGGGGQPETAVSHRWPLDRTRRAVVAIVSPLAAAFRNIFALSPVGLKRYTFITWSSPNKEAEEWIIVNMRVCACDHLIASSGLGSHDPGPAVRLLLSSFRYSLRGNHTLLFRGSLCCCSRSLRHRDYVVGISISSPRFSRNAYPHSSPLFRALPKHQHAPFIAGRTPPCCKWLCGL